MRAVCLAISAALLMSTAARAQAGGLPPVPPEAAPAAARALQTFAKLVTDDNAKPLGFASRQEVTQAELGPPAMVFFVRLDALRRYEKDKQDPRELLSAGIRVVYPVLVKGVPRSSIELAKEPGTNEWRAASFGDSTLGPELSRLRERKVQEERAAHPERAPPGFSIIRVPALSLYFLGHVNVRADRRHELILTPFADEGRFNFKAGESLPAGAVFEAIQSVARETPDLPG
jgi:hypothetical protein